METSTRSHLSRRFTALAAIGVASASLLTSCSASPADSTGLPDRPSDVRGTLSGEPATSLVNTSPTADGAWRHASASYFEGMSISNATEPSDDVVVDDAADALPLSTLGAGDQVEVWIADGCEESYPVRCTVLAIKLT